MNTGFKGYHPFVNVLFFISVIIFGMLFKHPVCLVISLVSSLAYYCKLTGNHGRKTVLSFFLPMLVLVVLINSFFNHYGVTVLFELSSGNNFTFEALIMGLVSGITVVSVIQWFFCFNEVVTEDKFMHIFGRILPKGALVLSMVFRFVPLYRRRYREISQSRKFLFTENSNGIISRIKFTCKNIGILVSWSFEKAIITADSMKARGYGLSGKTYYSRFKWNASDTLSLLVILIADILITVSAALKATYCIYNPYVVINPPAKSGTTYIINELNMTLNPFGTAGFILSAAYLLLCFLPLIADAKEDYVWHRLKSKI